jgi:phosphoribosylformimino-5-aminoimidazole carboxamide ribotide isomerase
LTGEAAAGDVLVNQDRLHPNPPPTMPARLVPVLDLKEGRAVHAVAGDRAHYGPLRSRLHPVPDPIALALAVRERFGPSELYVADLDAIAGSPPALGLFRGLAAEGFATWVDAGLADASGVAPLLDAGVATVVAGLETLRGPDALAAILDVAGPDRVILSLDLRDGRPILAPGADWGADDPAYLADAALRVGCRRLLVLDLARVGTGRGVGSLGLLRSLRSAWTDRELAIGGGVAGPDDLDELGRWGASVVLVGSALHDGRFSLGL